MRVNIDIRCVDSYRLKDLHLLILELSFDRVRFRNNENYPISAESYVCTTRGPASKCTPRCDSGTGGQAHHDFSVLALRALGGSFGPSREQTDGFDRRL